MQNRRLLLATTTSGLLSLLLASAATAADARGSQGPNADPAAAENRSVEEVVVTATKREESLLQVPMSVRALTGDTLQRQGADQFADYYRTVPSLTFQERPPGFNTVTVRGISAVGGAATTGIYYDDMPVNDAGFQSDIKLVDIERVEVLRGPQGTLYGEGSMGGTVKVITRKPDLNNFGGELGARLASTESGASSWGLEGVLNLPLVEDHAALRLVAYKRDLGGWIDNLARGEKDVNEENVEGGRASFKFVPNDRLSISLTALYQNQHVGGAQNTNPVLGELVQFRRRQEPSQDNFREYNGTVDYDLGFADFTSSTSYFTRDFVFTRDLQSLADVFGAGTSSLDVDLTTETFTEEARFSSKTNGRLRWVAGAFFKNRDAGDFETADLDFVNFYSARSDTRLRQAALFGEADYHVTDRLKLTAGLRAFRETLDIHSETVFFTRLPDFDGRQTSSGLNPKFAIDYQLDDDHLLYAVAAKGFRSGGVNSGGSSKPTYDPDHLWSYEVGVKGHLLDRRATFNLAAFYIDWRDIQISVPDPALPGLSFIDNAGAAHSVGVEAELTLRPVEGLEIGASAGFNDAILHELTQGGVVIYERARLPNVPKVKTDLSVEYSRPISHDISGFGRVDWSYTGSSMNGVTPAFTTQPALQRSYNLVNLRFGLRADHWELEGFVENLGNEIAQLNIDPGLSSPGNPVISVNRPRTIGVSIRSRF